MGMKDLEREILGEQKEIEKQEKKAEAKATAKKLEKLTGIEAPKKKVIKSERVSPEEVWGTPEEKAAWLAAEKERKRLEKMAPKGPPMQGIDDPFFGVEVNLIADGFGYLEGPVWVPQLEALLFSDILQDKIFQYNPKN